MESTTPKVIQEADGSFTISVNMKLSGTMLEQESQIQQGINLVGAHATKLALESFDTQDESIEIDGERMSSKGRQKKSI